MLAKNFRALTKCINLTRNDKLEILQSNILHGRGKGDFFEYSLVVRTLGVKFIKENKNKIIIKFIKVNKMFVFKIIIQVCEDSFVNFCKKKKKKHWKIVFKGEMFYLTITIS